MTSQHKTMLCVFAHPDDESFGPGGTLAKYAASGTRIITISTTRGEGSSLGHEEHKEHLGDVRVAEMQCASEVLGLKESRVLDYPDTKLDEVDEDELRDLFLRAILDIEPDMVMAFEPHGITGNPDHIAITRASTEAISLMRIDQRPDLFYWGLTEPAAQRLKEISGIPFAGLESGAINTIIDTSAHLGTHWKAIRCHKSQSDPLPPFLTEIFELQDGKEYFVKTNASTKNDPFATDFFS